MIEWLHKNISAISTIGGALTMAYAFLVDKLPGTAIICAGLIVYVNLHSHLSYKKMMKALDALFGRVEVGCLNMQYELLQISRLPEDKKQAEIDRVIRELLKRNATSS